MRTNPVLSMLATAAQYLASRGPALFNPGYTGVRDVARKRKEKPP